MNFLTRFLKIYIFALLLSGLGALIFYLLIIKGNKLKAGVSDDEFSWAVGYAVGLWFGFVTTLSLLIAFIGMKKGVNVEVSDPRAFLHKFDAVARSLRYRPDGQTDDSLIFKPPPLAIFAEKITVRLSAGAATIEAPRLLLRKIVGKL